METRQTRHLVASSSSPSKTSGKRRKTNTASSPLSEPAPNKPKRGRPRTKDVVTKVSGQGKTINDNKIVSGPGRGVARRLQNGTSTSNDSNSAGSCSGSDSCSSSSPKNKRSPSSSSAGSTLSSGSSGSSGSANSGNESSASDDTNSRHLQRTTAKRLRNLAGRKSSQSISRKSVGQDEFSICNGSSQPFEHHRNKNSSSRSNKQNTHKTRGRKRNASSSDESSPPKRQRSSALAAKLKIVHSPTATKIIKTNTTLGSHNNNLPHQKQYSSIEDATTQTIRSHQNNQPSRNKRSRSISSSCSRPSPLLNGGDYNENQSEGEEQTIRLRCPVEGCNSEGHLSGKLESHFTQTTCPVFHNMTPKECEDRYHNRKRGKRLDVEYVRNADISRPCTPSLVSFRDKVDTSPSKGSNRKLSQSPKTSQKSRSPIIKTAIKSEKLDSDESLLNRLVEHRKREINQIILQNSTPQKRPEIVRNPSREPNLKNLTPIFDHEMFKEAQAKAAEQLQEKARDVKMRYGIKCIDLGRYEIDVWYGSPYPEEYRYLPKLFICEFCLKYMTSAAVSNRHVQKCSLRHPPGNEIYRKGNISFFEVDGQQNEIYCQNLCLLAKLFLDHKTLYFDVAPFLFYVMTEYDEDGFHILGYFSKEKNSFLNYNVSCILTLPPYQKQGYGKLLIDLSYLMTRLEGKVGSPEKPLSDMGLISYRSYWKLIILEYLCNYQAKEISIKDISQETGVNAYDIISTLQAMGMLKYWKGKHLILTRQDILDDYRVNRRKKDSFKRIDPSCLRWTPPTS